ncbi:MAG TPA: type I methionyl aminopeptidase, partial [Polyangiaceae bacterium LLY-WYZ-15_(1-7)]|nr:type I methionyl aminopeptidase [Polyangiaceae bacterium LLY-WYZ-15_(1-7)]
GPRQVAKMRAAGRVAAETLAAVGAALRPGMSTADIDRLVRADTARRGARPSQLGYHGFPAAVCTSRNEVVCHGIPREDEHLEEGDLVSVDVTSELGGWHGDNCASFALGALSAERAHLLDVGRRCRDAGIAALRDGVRLGDVGAAIEALARREGCSVVRDYGGHGIGRAMHLPPHVAHVGPAGRGRRLRAGMALTVEPMIVLGDDPTVVVDADGWTVRTRSGAPCVQFEHTVLVTREGAEILTRARSV